MEDPFHQKANRRGNREDRSSIRQEIRTIARYVCPSQGKESEVQVRVIDISEHGALFVTRRDGIPLGAEVRASFRLPGLENESLTIVGKVKHVRFLEENEYGNGVEFLSLSEKERLAIRSFISIQQLGEFI